MAATFENSYKNIPVYAKAGVNIRAGAGTSAKVLHTVAQAQRIGTATGYFVGEWVQVIPDKKRTDGTLTAYVHKNYVATTKPANQQNTQIYAGNFDNIDNPTDADTTALFNAIADNDQLLYKRLLVTWEVLERMRKRGIDTIKYEKVFEVILNSYKKRQREIASMIARQTSAKAYEDVVPGVTPGFGKVWAWLASKFVGFSGIGAIQLIPMAILILAGVIIGKYFFKDGKKHYDEGKIHLNISEQFKQVLDALPPSLKEAILKDINEQMKDAYNIGYEDGKKDASGGIGDAIKWIGISILGILGITLVSRMIPKKETIQVK